MSGPKHTPAWERVVTLDDHDALKRELAEERDRAKRLAAALKDALAGLKVARQHYGMNTGHLEDKVRAALREAGES